MFETPRPSTVPTLSADAAFTQHAEARAVSWRAIAAGAVAAAALSLILVILGTGLGLSSVSPWSGAGASAKAISISTIAWLAFTQLAAAGVGGYLAGRLRVRWPGVPGDEVYFRDTAHGFLAWAVATLLTAALLTTAIAGVLGIGARVGATASVATVGAATSGAMTTPAAAATFSRQDAEHYVVDAMLRPGVSATAPSADGVASPVASVTPADATPTAMPTPTPTAAAAPPVSPEERRSLGVEVGRIFASALNDGALPARDAQYLAQLIAQRSGVGPAEAEKRVAETFQQLKAKARAFDTQAREAADVARKASAHASLWMFVALLLGAFVASLTATWGGRQRDL